jgi:hypothetical protein
MKFLNFLFVCSWKRHDWRFGENPYARAAGAEYCNRVVFVTKRFDMTLYIVVAVVVFGTKRFDYDTLHRCCCRIVCGALWSTLRTLHWSPTSS